MQIPGTNVLKLNIESVPQDSDIPACALKALLKDQSGEGEDREPRTILHGH